MSSCRRSCGFWAAVVLILGCSKSCGDSAPAADGYAHNARSFSEAFPSDELLEIELELSDDDWDKLRGEGRSLNDVFSACNKPFEYTLMSARATIAGHAHDGIQVRKKGFLGSLSTRTPSLRLELGDDSYRDQAELTLNNNLSDKTLLRQCIAYPVFAAAGLAAPGCALAAVSVNGQRLGIYTNVEPVKRGLLERHFGSADGNLYEASALSDFRAGALDYFERKNNRKDPERKELEAVAAALELTDDEEMLAALEPLVDLDYFIRFWAVEVLVGHWDGYAGNINNMYIYRAPSSDKLVFIPWGTDQAFEKTNEMLPETGRPPVTWAFGRLTRRLYAYEPTRERYYAQLRELLETVWDEKHLHAEIDRLSALVDGAPAPAAVDELRAFIDTRRADIERELSADPVPWEIPERNATSCMPQYTTPIRGTFSTTWGTLDAPMPREPGSTIEANVNGEQRSLQGLSSAGATAAKRAALNVIGVLGDGRYLVAYLELPELPDELPADVELHGFETFGILLVSRGPGSPTTTVGYIGSGKIHFDRAATEAGAEVVGSFEAMFSQTAALPAN